MYQNTRKEQTSVRQVTGPYRTKFLASPQFCSTQKMPHVTTTATKMRFVAVA